MWVCASSYARAFNSPDSWQTARAFFLKTSLKKKKLSVKWNESVSSQQGSLLQKKDVPVTYIMAES